MEITILNMANIFYFNLLSIPVLVAFGFSFSMFYIIFFKENKQGEKYFSLYSLSCSLYAFFYALELSTSSEKWIEIFLQLQYLGASFISTFLLLFAIKFSQNDKLISKKFLTGIFVIPVITLIMALSNPYHRLFYSEFSTFHNDFFLVSKTEKGIFYNLHQIYSILTSIVADILIIRFLFVVPKAYFARVLVVLIGVLVSWLSYISQLSDNTPYGLNTIPLVFGLTSIIIYFGLIKFDLFDSIPIAYKTLFKNLKDGVIVTDINNQVIEINNSAANILGANPKSSNIDIQNALNNWYELNELIQNTNEETDKILQNGEEWYEVSINSNYSDKGIFLGKSITLRNITSLELNKQEKELALQLLKETNELAQVGGWEYYPEESKVVWSYYTKILHETGISYNPSLEEAINFYKEGYSRNKIVSTLEHTLKCNETFDLELELVTAKGNEIWVRVIGKPEFKNNECVKLYGAIQNISEKKINELKLERAKKEAEENALYYRSLLENQSVFILKTDLEGKITYANDFYVKEFLKAKNIFTHNPMIEIIEEDLSKVLDVVNNCISNPNKGYQVVFRKRNVRNEVKGCQWEFKALTDREGNLKEILCVGYDISELLEKQKKLKELVDITAEQNNRLLKFAHIVSHNIRSHVSNMIGLIELIHLDNLENSSEYINLLKESAISLDDTIKDLNEIVSIQTNVKLPKRKIDIKLKIEKIISGISSLADKRGIEIENLCENLEIKTNVSYFESIILNLITNSIKYSDPNKKKKFVRISTSTDDNYVKVEVEDNGLGINLNKVKDKIFGMYNTFHGNSDAKGMGLFITKTQIEVLNGKIEVESKVGVGSKFIVYFKKS